MHYHQCSEFVASTAKRRGPRRRVGVAVVDEGYAVSQHYRSCFTAVHNRPSTCRKLLGNAILDDAVLRYRRQLIDKVRRVLDTGILHYDSANNGGAI